MPDQLKYSARNLRLLVCLDDRKGEEEALSILRRNGIDARVVRDLAELEPDEIEGAGALLLRDEALKSPAFRSLVESIGGRSGWPEPPLIIAVDGAEARSEALGILEAYKWGGAFFVTALPVVESNLLSAAAMALRLRERQRAQSDMLEQRDAILYGIDNLLVLLDKDYRVIAINEKAAGLIGSKPEELIGRTEWDIDPSLVGGEYQMMLHECAEKNEASRLEYRDHVTGSWYEKRIIPSRSGIIVIGEDITDRRAEEEALRRSDEKFRLIVDSAVEYAIFSIDSGGTITSWNSGAERLLGYAESEVAGRNFEMFFTPDDRQKGVPSEQLRKVFETGKSDDEYWQVRKDGSRFLAGSQVMPMEEGGEIRGYVNVMRDHTGRKRAETWLRALNETLEKRIAERTAEAERRAAQLQMLAVELTEAEERERKRLAEMLHDHLQQILVAAKMHVGMLSQKQVEGALRDGLDRVDNLLSRSIEASRSMTVELAPPILYDAGLGPALHLLARRMGEDHGIEVVVDAQDGGVPESENVRVFLFQAIRELLLNVVKHAGVKHAEVRMIRFDHEVEVSVTDSGAGFDPGQIDCTRGRGSGFGLLRIGERAGFLGGTMSVETSSGKGTRVVVRVPQRENHFPAALGIPPEPREVLLKEKPSRAVAAGAPGAIRILLADDHKILREGLAGLLRDQPDFEIVSEASDGQMAVDMARETRPDVIIMDISMPRLNGVEATRKIMSEMPDVKVIGLSMHAQEEMAEEMRRAGAIEYVTKGAPSEILTAAIRNAALIGAAKTEP